MKPKILVLGGSGFVGGEVVRVLRDRGHAVRATRRAGEKIEKWEENEEESGEEVEWVEVDLERAESIEGALQGCVAVIHAAGYEPGVGVTMREGLQRGLRELRSVLDGCLTQGVRRIVYVSSAATMNSGQVGGVYDETDFYTPGQSGDVYFEVKYRMEAELYQYFDRGLEILVALPSLVLGPGSMEAPSGQVVRRILEADVHPELAAEPLNVVDVRDVATALVAAMESGRAGRRYALGGVNTDVGSLRGAFVQVMDANDEGGSGSVQGKPSERLIDRLRAQAVERLKHPVVEQVAEFLPEKLVRKAGRGEEGEVDTGLQRYSGHIQSQRARGELGHRPRLLAQTIAASVPTKI